MSSVDVDRKIAVIWVADAVGYSKHMERDETGTIQSYQQCDAILQPLLKKYKGAIFNTGGDSVLAEFPSAVNAVECGVAFQKAIKERNALENTKVKLEFRLGINMGDVIQTEGNLLGDGVNIATRLEALCLPGSISISKNIYDLVSAKTSLSFNGQGIQKVKDNEFHVYDVLIDPNQKRSLKTKPKSNTPLLGAIAAVIIAGVLGVYYFTGMLGTSNEKPRELALNTIAVVPFDVRSDDANIDNLATGIFTSVVSGLSKSEMAINSVPISNEQTDMKENAHAAGAFYILTGSVLSNNRDIRTNVRLLNSETMAVIWSSTLEGNLETESVFATQDRMAFRIVDTLVGNGSILATEVSLNTENKAAKELSIFECIAVSRNYLNLFEEKLYGKATECLSSNIERNPNNGKLLAYLANIKLYGVQFKIYNDPEKELNEAINFADQAISLDPLNARGHYSKGRAKFIAMDWDGMYKSIEKVIELAPSNPEFYSQSGYMLYWGGTCAIEDYRDRLFEKGSYTDGTCRWKLGFDLLIEAEKLDPKNFIPLKHYGIACAYEYWGEEDNKFYQKAYDQVQLTYQPGFLWYEMHSGVAAAGMGKDKLAQKHFDAVKTAIGSNKLEDAYSHHANWNVHKTYWLLSKPFLIQYGFE